MQNENNSSGSKARKAGRFLLCFLLVFFVALSAISFSPLKVQAATPKLSKKSVTLYVEQTKKLKVKNTKEKVTWSSSNKKVATVSKKGVVTAKKAGKVKITAKFGSKKLVCKITVKNPKLNKTKLSLCEGDKFTLKVIKTSKKITWSSSDKSVATVSKKGVVTAKSPGNATITAKFGKFKKKCVVNVSYKDTIKLNDLVIPVEEEDIEDFTENVEDVTTEVISTDFGESYNYQIKIDQDAEIVKDLENGEIKEGDVMMIPSCDRFPAGFYFTVVSYEISDTDCIIIARQPEFDELFKDEGTIDFNKGISAEDPIAFIMTGDGDLFSGDRLDSYLAGNIVPEGTDTKSANNNSSYQLGASDDNEVIELYSQKIFPEGIKFTPYIYKETDGTVSMQIQTEDNLVYDKDMNGKTKDDQILLDGTIGILNIDTDGKMTFGKGINKVIPEQIAFGMQYDTKYDLQFKMKSAFDLKTIAKEIREQKKKDTYKKYLPGEDFLGYTVDMNGVDMDGRFFLGTIGLRASGPFACAGLNRAVSYDPVFFVSLYIALDGTISVEGSIGVTYESHVERGFDFYDSKGKHVTHDHSFDKNTTVAGSWMLGSYEKEVAKGTANEKPETKVGFTMKGKIKSDFGIGVAGGVSVSNLIPGDVFGEITSGFNGTIEGSFYGMTGKTTIKDFFGSELRLLLDNTVRFRWGLEFAFAVHIANKYMTLIDLDYGTNLNWEKILRQATYEYPGATLTGKIFDCDTNYMKGHDPVEDMKIFLFNKAQFNPSENTEINVTDIPREALNDIEPDGVAISFEDGSFQIEHLVKGKYVVLIRKDGYHDLITELNITEDQDGFSKDIYQDYYVYQYNWLDECAPVSYNNGDSHGTGVTYDGSNKDKYMTMSGVYYSAGFSMNNGNQGTGGTLDALFNLDGKYDALDVRLGHLDDTSLLNGTLSIYLANTEEDVWTDDYLVETFQLNSMDASQRVHINLLGATYARFSLKKTQWDNWANASYGFVEGVWTRTDGTVSPYNTTTFKDPYEGRNMTDTNFLNIVPIFAGTSCKTYNGGNDTFQLKGSDEIYDTGFTLSSYSVGGPNARGKALFFPDGHFNSLDMDVGFVRQLKNSEFYVYLDGETEPSQTYTVTKDTITHVSIPINGARSVRIEIKNTNDNWSTDCFGFTNGVWR